MDFINKINHVALICLSLQLGMHNFVLLRRYLIVLIERYARFCLDSKVFVCPDRKVYYLSVSTIRYDFVHIMRYEYCIPHNNDIKPNPKNLTDRQNSRLYLYPLLKGQNMRDGPFKLLISPDRRTHFERWSLSRKFLPSIN